MEKKLSKKRKGVNLPPFYENDTARNGRRLAPLRMTDRFYVRSQPFHRHGRSPSPCTGEAKVRIARKTNLVFYAKILALIFIIFAAFKKASPVQGEVPSEYEAVGLLLHSS